MNVFVSYPTILRTFTDSMVSVAFILSPRVKTLDAQTKAEITAKISASVKGTLEITENVDESLIGGFIVRMGDHQIDASVSNQLNRLKQELVK